MSESRAAGPVRNTAFPRTATRQPARDGQSGVRTTPPSHPPAGAGGAPQSHQRTQPVQQSQGVRTYTGQQGPAQGPAQPGARPARPAGRTAGPRRVRLALTRVDPWSVMKLAFLASIAIGIGIVVATAVLWWVLNQMEVFAQMRSLIEEAEAMAQFGPLLEYLEFSRVMSVATVVAVVDIALLTALATLGAFVSNIVAAMIGGLHLTLTDD